MAFSSMRKPTTCVIAFFRLTMMNRLTNRSAIASGRPARVGSTVTAIHGRANA